MRLCIASAVGTDLSHISEQGWLVSH